jgi:hypothetical protein
MRRKFARFRFERRAGASRHAVLHQYLQDRAVHTSPGSRSCVSELLVDWGVWKAAPLLPCILPTAVPCRPDAGACNTGGARFKGGSAMQAPCRLAPHSMPEEIVLLPLP